MTARTLHLHLTLDTYDEGDRWTWTLMSGRHIVSTSGGQFFSRRTDCARGAEAGAGLEGVRRAIQGREFGVHGRAVRRTSESPSWIAPVPVHVEDIRPGKCS